ncbi:MAG: DUF6384 family protein [Parvularculaceae bacterium]
MSATALAPAQPAPVPAQTQKLDDVMLAMDVVDTLRHRERLVEMELGGEAREEALIKRLREIYAAQGIEVPDAILKDGVKALEEKRFVYEPPRDGVGVRLAKLYVSRDRWLKPLAILLGVALFATGAYEFGYAGPRAARLEQTQTELTQRLPNALASAREAALSLAIDDPSRARIEAAHRAGAAALGARDARKARAAVLELQQLKDDLNIALTVRIVSRPNEYSGVFRIPDNAPGARNYYLIVEAVDGSGRAHSLDIASEEDQATKRVDKWGVRVPESVFNAVAADKKDDSIIENAVIGEKPKGKLAPEYGKIDGAGGAILEW